MLLIQQPSGEAREPEFASSAISGPGITSCGTRFRFLHQRAGFLFCMSDEDHWAARSIYYLSALYCIASSRLQLPADERKQKVVRRCPGPT